MKKLIGYVGKTDLLTMKEEDIKALNIVNVAFGNIVNGVVVFDYEPCVKAVQRMKEINPEIKVLLSVGGWSSGGFSEAAMTTEGRAKVASSSVEIMGQYGFDGIDIDWEYPCFSVAGIVGRPEDKVNFTYFIRDLKEAISSKYGESGMLTIAAGGDGYFVRCTEIEKVAEYLDYIQLMTYDLRGGFQVLTGHHTNLYAPDADLFEASGDKAVKAFVDAGVPASKLVLGVAFYSRQWKGVPDVNRGLHQMAETTGGYGPSYGELVESYINKNGYVRYWDEQAKAPYLFNGNCLISYDDEESIAHKIDYAINQGLYGLMYWEYCCDETYTLTKYMRGKLDE